MKEYAKLRSSLHLLFHDFEETSDFDSIPESDICIEVKFLRNSRLTAVSDKVPFPVVMDNVLHAASYRVRG